MKKHGLRVVAAGLATATAFGFSAVPAFAAENEPAPVEAVATQGEDAEGTYDLEPFFQVAAGKAKGFAGLVAIRVKNVGTERYYQEFPLTTFKVQVKTEKGPKGVDRLITPGKFNGAYAYDEGFDPKTSTRTFTVTLSNPINPGETKTVANLNFGDGLTKEGRLQNYVTVTQTGRHEKDVSTENDQNVDSRQHTVTDGGKRNAGIF